MELIFLLLGVGLGFLGSRITRSVPQPAISTPSLPQETPMNDLPSPKAHIEPLQEEPKPLPKDIEPLEEEPKPVEANVEPLEEQLKQIQLAYLMAQEMSQFKGGFLARTAHELRSPLSSLIGMHQLILSDLCDSPEEEREFVAQANTSALKMVKILDEVITVSKIEHGSNRLDIHPLPLTQILAEVQGLTHMQAANSNLQYDVVLPDPEIYVLADSRRFRQVLVAIVDSAITKLADLKEGCIKISAFSVPDSQEVGIWIDVQTPTSAWSEVVDLLATTPEAEKPPMQTAELSPGLTLLMAQTLVEVMQGKLEVLPLSDEELAATSATENFIRLQCSMPLAIPEPVEQALA
ncbi:sensor histidine kinase [Allocoleopsis franciscana]|uniref:histidine kinase n=1 Tax=Allocoleopsis franciscana PCC 7113 TaxID=1173027 RepID=K9W9J5_9CYAN|nr:HAMP domain-containing sensor histidine kinase [Allocoleopsis franciscana]AFZ16157.1 histidine kinase [Allocoleopsis franciscana PCC 7113]